MIEAQIPKDIRKYEAKLAGPFTLRQLICFGISCALAFFVYKLVLSFSDANTAIPMCMIAISPVIAVGWVKPYGMPLEKFLQTAFISNVLAPKVRKYKTRNAYKISCDKLVRMSDKEYKKRIKYDKKMATNNEKYEMFK